MPRGAAALTVLISAAIAAPAAGQLPPTPGAPSGGEALEQLVLVSLNVPTAPQEVPLLGQAQYDIVVEDLSADKAQERSGVYHTIRLDLEYNRSEAGGWNVLMGPFFFSPSYGGSTWRSFAIVQATPTVKGQYFRFTVHATLTSSLGPVAVDSQDVVAHLRPFSLAAVNLLGAPPHAGPFEEVQIPFTISNGGQYHDTFLVSAEAPLGWFVSVQPRLTVFPGETREVLVHAITPANRVFQPQETAVVLVRVRSELDPEVVYERAAVVILEGVFLPGYWAPVAVLGVVLLGALLARGMEVGRRQAREQGRPAPPRLTPAQQVLLADLKRRDPERYRAIVAQQRRLSRARERAWGVLRGKRMVLERAVVQRQHEEVRIQKHDERQKEKALIAKGRELERRRAALAREEERGRRELEAQRQAAELRQRREEERRRRRQAPMQRRLEGERRARERRLRAELARKQRLLAAEQRKRRVAKERRARELARRKRELEKKQRRRGRGGPEGGAPPP